MRRPSAAIVVDAAILIAAVRGRGSAALIAVSSVAALATTDRAVEEARRRIEVGMRRPELLSVLFALTAELTISPLTSLEHRLPDAAIALRDATHSRNGTTDDAHILALAWEVEGDIWSTDRDFSGTGVAVWSTPNLVRALANSAD